MIIIVIHTIIYKYDKPYLGGGCIIMKLLDLFESPVVDTIPDDNGNPDIQITIYTTGNRSEHPPAHIHAQTYDGSDVPIDIETGTVVNSKMSYGSLTKGNRLKKIRRWITINHNQLLIAWERAQKGQDPRIGFKPWNSKDE